MPTHFEPSYCKSDEYNGKQTERPVHSQDGLTSLIPQWLHRLQQYKTLQMRIDCRFLREDRRRPCLCQTRFFAGAFQRQGQSRVAVRENVRLSGTVYMCQKSTRRRVLGRGTESICHDHRNLQDRQPQSVSKRSFVGVCRTLMSFETRYVFRPRWRHQPTAANISSTRVAGSGTAAFAVAPAPLPAVWPKWERHTS
jgi:hypothetical protein